MGSAICGEDFRQGPRTWEALGLAELGRADLKTFLREGEVA